MGLTRLWAGARAANYLSPAINVAISNVPGPRQTIYCVGAPATHYYPVSIPYHGCALNITVQSYLDQLDFGLVACSETVPDAQSIADFLVEDFVAMRKADAQLSEPEPVEAIALERRTVPPLSSHEPIELAEAKAEPGASKDQRGSALMRNIEALSATTDALLRRLDDARTAASVAAEAQRSRPKAKGRKLASASPGTKRGLRKAPASVERAPPASPPARGRAPCADPRRALADQSLDRFVPCLRRPRTTAQAHCLSVGRQPFDFGDWSPSPSEVHAFRRRLSKVRPKLIGAARPSHVSPPPLFIPHHCSRVETDVSRPYSSRRLTSSINKKSGRSMRGRNAERDFCASGAANCRRFAASYHVGIGDGVHGVN